MDDETSFPHPLADDARTLAAFEGWSRPVYADLLRLRRREMSEEEFNRKYHRQRAILSLDMTGLTSSAIEDGELNSLLRIVDAQKVCIPVLQEFGAEVVRCFADDIVAVFANVDPAANAAFEIHRRIRRFNESPLASEHPTQCCIGVGYGLVYAIGPNLAQGDEMNRASKLGEDLARPDETLVTERAYAALRNRADIRFECREFDRALFRYYRAVPID